MFTSCAVWIALANSQLPGTWSVLAYCTFKFQFSKEDQGLHSFKLRKTPLLALLSQGQKFCCHPELVTLR